MKIWLSKYALTQGIIEVEAEYCGEKTNMIRVIDDGYKGCYQGEGINWHRTKEDALKRAEEMKIRKINFHRKQIEKLEGLDFNK
jgi:hypothetical protein